MIGAAVRVDGRRLLQRLEVLASFTAPGEGVTRLAWSPEEVAARDTVAGWMAEAGLEPQLDAATNLVGCSPASGSGDRPWLVTGSHLDTVVEGGKLDGCYGVVAAIEAAAALRDAGVDLHLGLRVVAFANEEGARGSLGMFGSRCLAGALPPWALGPDDSGVEVAERIRRAGGRPGRLAAAAWAPGEVAATVELHVEQGPVLASAQAMIGVVEGITGQCHAELRIRGVANHAGTTPMAARSDALAAASEVVLAVEDLARSGAVRVATCGYISATPNVRNVVPGEVVLGIDIRDMDADRMASALERLRNTVAEIAAGRGVSACFAASDEVLPVRCDPLLVDAIEQAASGLGFASARLPSGAGHDAQIMASLGPIAMIFVPSDGGVSHSPAEHTGDEALVAGADVLASTLALADRLLARRCAGEPRS